MRVAPPAIFFIQCMVFSLLSTIGFYLTPRLPTISHVSNANATAHPILIQGMYLVSCSGAYMTKNCVYKRSRFLRSDSFVLTCFLMRMNRIYRTTRGAHSNALCSRF
jgi:2-hydroxychromene-2-carboxylate isomerase